MTINGFLEALEAKVKAEGGKVFGFRPNVHSTIRTINERYGGRYVARQCPIEYVADLAGAYSLAGPKLGLELEDISTIVQAADNTLTRLNNVYSKPGALEIRKRMLAILGLDENAPAQT